MKAGRAARDGDAGRDGRRKLSAPKLKAPRGTYDVLGEQAEARATLEARAKALLEGAGYERIETPAFEATELFARGVGESTDIVRKEMFTFDDGGGRSLTLRPEGTAPVCRAYVEHGMHKRRQPVKLWYLSSFFRHERAQAGRYRQFWQVGAEALGSDDPAVDAESIALLAALLSQMGVREVRLRLSSLGSVDSRAEYRQRLQDYLRANEQSLSADVRSRIEQNPLRAFDADHEGTRRVMADAPRLLDHLSDEDSEHFAQVRELLDEASVRLRDRLHARARPGLLHAHRLRVHLRRARRAERRRRRRSLRRPRRAPRRAPDARHGLGGRRRADDARRRRAGHGRASRRHVRRAAIARPRAESPSRCSRPLARPG